MRIQRYLIMIALIALTACNNSTKHSATSEISKREEVEIAQIQTAIDKYKNKMFSESFKEFEIFANKGNSEAQYYLGCSYDNAYGVKLNVKEGVKWLTKSADQGNAKALVDLGGFYLYGTGVNKDTQYGLKLFNEAADKGNALARFNLGLLYQQGAVVEKDITKAINYYEQAANQGNIPAQYNLGVMYMYGKDIPIEEEKAVKYLKLAAKSGDEDIEVELDKAIGLLLTKKIETHPTRELYEQRGAQCFKMKMYDFAAEDFYRACYGDGMNIKRGDAESFGCKMYMSMRLGRNIDSLVQKYIRPLKNNYRYSGDRIFN